MTSFDNRLFVTLELLASFTSRGYWLARLLLGKLKLELPGLTLSTYQPSSCSPLLDPASWDKGTMTNHAGCYWTTNGAHY